MTSVPAFGAPDGSLSVLDPGLLGLAPPGVGMQAGALAVAPALTGPQAPSVGRAAVAPTVGHGDVYVPSRPDDRARGELSRTMETLRDAAARQQASVAAQPAEIIATVAPSAIVTLRATEALVGARSPVPSLASSQPVSHSDPRVSETQAAPSIDEPDPTPELTTAASEHALAGPGAQDAKQGGVEGA